MLSFTLHAGKVNFIAGSKNQHPELAAYFIELPVIKNGIGIWNWNNNC